MKIKTTIITSSIGIITLFLISFIAASGVSGPYWEGFPLSLAKGESQVVSFNYYNFEGTEDIRVQVSITSGSDIASLSEESYLIEAGVNKFIPITIKMPADAQAGETRKVGLLFKTITPSQTGMVTLGTGQTWAFDVVTKEEEAKQSSSSGLAVTLIGLAVIVLALVIVAFLLKKKRK
jgi:uncharacterized membrane protein